TGLPITSAVTRASSRIGRSLVPAQTTAIVPLPCIVRSRQTRTARASGRCSGQKEVARFCQKRARDLFHLVYRLAHPKNHFRHAVAESPVVVYLCKS